MHKSSILATVVLATLVGCDNTDQTADKANQNEPAEQADQSPRVATDAEAHAPAYGGGIISEPVRQLRTIENRILDLNITRAMNAFRAEHQRSPESHEEFMEMIIQRNFISLPELEEGWEYKYDPEALNEQTGNKGVLHVVPVAVE